MTPQIVQVRPEYERFDSEHTREAVLIGVAFNALYGEMQAIIVEKDRFIEAVSLDRLRLHKHSADFPLGILEWEPAKPQQGVTST